MIQIKLIKNINFECRYENNGDVKNKAREGDVCVPPPLKCDAIKLQIINAYTQKSNILIISFYITYVKKTITLIRK